MKMEPFTKSPLEDKFYHSNFWKRCLWYTLLQRNLAE